MDRRGFLGSILALGAAPAIVRADSLMRIIPLDAPILLMDGSCSPPGIQFYESSVLGPGDVYTIEGIFSDRGDLMRFTYGDTLRIRLPNTYRVRDR